MLYSGRRALKRVWLGIGRFIKFVFKRDGRWWIVLVAVTVAFGVGLSLHFWELLHDDEDSLSETISNLSLVLGGIVAIELAVWRSIVSESQTDAVQRQADAALRQAKTALRQAETAQSGLLNERFQKGAEMLGNDLLSVRLGGIYALKHLAVDNPEQFHVQCMEQLCAFIRGATRADGQPTASLVETVSEREKNLPLFRNVEDPPTELTIKRFVARNDIQEALNAITFCHDGNIEIETKESYWLDLRGTDLRGVDFSFRNLSRAYLSYSYPTTLPKMAVIGSYTDMRDTILDDVSLLGTNLARVDLSNATGLTQVALDHAYHAWIDPNDVPKLDGAVDANTGKPLVWND